MPLHPSPRPQGAELLVSKHVGRAITAARRRASRLAAGAVPLHPTPRPQGAGLLVGKHAGRAITAARRKASRLAGLVWLPAGWPIQTAIRRQASWLAIKASVILISRWPFTLHHF